MEHKDIDTEIVHWIDRLDDKYCMRVNHYSIQDIKDTALHFSELGCRRTAEKYDEIEYNRQRSEESKKPMNQDWLEEEIKRYGKEEMPAVFESDLNDIARHFAQWGAVHSGSSEIPNSMEEAANEYEKANTGIYPEVGQTSIRDAFIDGAKWDRQQMMKEAVEVRVQTSPLNGPLGISTYCCNFPSNHPFYHCKEGDKVRIIIVKED